MDASGREDSDSQNIIKIRALGSHFVAIFRFRRTQCNTPYTVICLTLQSPLEIYQGEICKLYRPVCIVGSKILEGFGFAQKVLRFFGAVFGPLGGRGWAQNVALGASFRTPKYRPNPANGGPVGGEKPL